MKKIKITEKQFRILTEEINASEAYEDIETVKTIINNKRGVGWLAFKSVPKHKMIEIGHLINDNGLQLLHVPSSPHDSYVIYKTGYEDNAKELVDIAEKYDGFLHWNATEEDSRRIGKLLGYKDSDVDDYIKRVQKQKDSYGTS